MALMRLTSIGRSHLNALRFGQTQRESGCPDAHGYGFTAQSTFSDNANLLAGQKAQFGQATDRFFGNASGDAHGSDSHDLTFFHIGQGHTSIVRSGSRKVGWDSNHGTQHT
jgi:hypothetical protein